MPHAHARDLRHGASSVVVRVFGRRKGGSESHLISAFQLKDFACLVRRRNLEAQTLEDLPDKPHLFGVALGQATRAGPQRVFKAYANVATHGRCHRRDWQLMTSRAKDAPPIVVTEQ